MLGERSVSARRRVNVPPVVVYALLADLSRHWPLLGSDLVDAKVLSDREAELVLRGPLPGVTRRVTTRVTNAEPTHAFAGEAEAGASRAAIDWRLEAAGAESTDVSITVALLPGAWIDGALMLGARRWLRIRCERVLERLDGELRAQAA